MQRVSDITQLFSDCVLASLRNCDRLILTVPYETSVLLVGDYNEVVVAFCFACVYLHVRLECVGVFAVLGVLSNSP